MSRRSRHDSSEDDLDRIAGAAAVFIVLVVVGLIAKYGQQILTYGTIAIVVMVAVLVGLWLWKRNNKSAALNLDDEKILYMLRGMSPARFEQEVANMFTALGYSAEVVGGANDGGIDVVAHKDGKKFYIQCKKFMTREVTPHDVRDFLGAITNIKNPADKGYFITTNKFTLAAEKTGEQNPRIELIDANRLVEYYKMAFGKKIPIPEPPPLPVPVEQSPRTYPRCGGPSPSRPHTRANMRDTSSGAARTTPKCTYLENIQEAVAAH
jgi:restriction system protein